MSNIYMCMIYFTADADIFLVEFWVGAQLGSGEGVLLLGKSFGKYSLKWVGGKFLIFCSTLLNRSSTPMRGNSLFFM